MIIWTLSNGGSGAADACGWAAAEATTAAAAWLHATAPRTLGWGGPHAGAVIVCVEDTDTRLGPCYDRRGLYDPDAPVRAAHRLRDELTVVLPTPAGGTGAPGATRWGRGT